MFYLKGGDIVPQTRIGSIELGMGYAQLKKIMTEFELDQRNDAYVMIAGDVQVWVDKKTNQATQILVENGFKGKYAGSIGLGSTLNEVKKALNKNWYEELDVYFIEGVPGICFSLEDSGDDHEQWDPSSAPFDYIAVFRD